MSTSYSRSISVGVLFVGLLISASGQNTECRRVQKIDSLMRGSAGRFVNGEFVRNYDPDSSIAELESMRQNSGNAIALCSGLYWLTRAEVSHMNNGVDSALASVNLSLNAFMKDRDTLNYCRALSFKANLYAKSHLFNARRFYGLIDSTLFLLGRMGPYSQDSRHAKLARLLYFQGYHNAMHWEHYNIAAEHAMGAVDLATAAADTASIAENELDLATVYAKLNAADRYDEHARKAHRWERILMTDSMIGPRHGALTLSSDIGQYAYFLDRMANGYVDLGLHAQARTLFEQSIHVSDSARLYYKLPMTLAEYATCLRQSGDTTAARMALARITDLLDSLDEDEQKIWRRRVKSEWIAYYKGIGSYREAYALMKTLGPFEYPESTQWIMETLDRGILALQTRSWNEAVAHCGTALAKVELKRRGVGADYTVGGLGKLAMDCHDCLAQAYRGLGVNSSAFEHLTQYHAIRDSLRLAQQNTQALDDLLTTEYEKRMLVDSLESARKDELAAKELEKEQVNIARQRLALFSLSGGLVLLGLLAVAIRRGKKRSDELLLNILPQEVAEELKSTGAAAAKHFDQATILFTDFKGFTQLSEQVTPTALVAELNTCFKAFDTIVTARGIEKIKTIGDAYMAAGGLPDPASSTPADVVHAALEMQDFMQKHKAQREAADKPFFEMRVGIHTGPVVAGIVGVKKFSYDIWGDTVNIASRMESSGEVGQVNISEATYELVKNETGLRFTPRGKVQAKGKGEMEMYFVGGSA